MKLATFSHAGWTRVGVIEGDRVADLGGCVNVPRTLRELLARFRNPAAELASELVASPRLALDDVQLQAPIADPLHVFAVGLNYREHAIETGNSLPTRPRLFIKLGSSIARPRGQILHPGLSDSLDYEGELGVVIGRPCKAASRARAREFVAGYLIVNDVSLREWVNPDLLVLGKGCATFAPMGPWLTTADEIADPHALRIRTHVNGELRQDASTADMVFDCWTLIECISRAVELQPGDVIMTGSPHGSGVSFAPPRFLQAGDRVRVEIEGLGCISNTVALAS